MRSIDWPQCTSIAIVGQKISGNLILRHTCTQSGTTPLSTYVGENLLQWFWRIAQIAVPGEHYLEEAAENDSDDAY